jgi:hypothetical protein
MGFLGDLERLFADTLYPIRVPLAIVTAAVIGGVAVLAWRRGWSGRALDLARRRPLVTGGAAVAVLAIGIPTFWYLASPLWERTTLVEENLLTVPAAAAAVATETVPVGAPAAPSPVAAATEPPVDAPRLIGAGEVQGADEFHFGSGRAELFDVDGMHVVQLREFSVRNGPDLYVYLSGHPEQLSEDAINLGRLKATDGDFGYDVPDGAMLPKMPYLLVWCEAFAVLFATASLEEGT